MWDSDSKSFVQLKEGSEKAKENYEVAAKKRYDLFMAQDKENGHFDVAFKFKDQKILYAHKFMLTCLSPVFQAMFTKNWDKEASIDIKFNTFNEFKTILKFFYLGVFNFKEEGATLLLDFAECFNILLWAKNQCQNFETTSEMHKGMRDLLLEIFPYIRFAIMDIKYIYQIFSDYDLLFTPEERNDIIYDICDLKSINTSRSRSKF
uniref:BTB domain-containing protein n=1 Tax=Panagrolaimus sp. PS1159 TaxID=55785 RepID=A0AC35F9J5_9BILA